MDFQPTSTLKLTANEAPSVEMSAEFGPPVRVIPFECVIILTPEESAELNSVSGPDD